VILTWQTCGQRSSMSAGSKRRALAFYFCAQICYMFPTSKCRRESDLGLCATSVLANGMPPRICKFRQILRPNTSFNRMSPPCSGILFSSAQVVRRPRSNSPVHFDMRNLWQIRASARRLLTAYMLDRCLHDCRVKITFGLLPTNHFVSTKTDSMKCLVNWNLLRIRVCLRNTQPNLKICPKSTCQD